jgi:hypothetical protein
LFRNDDDVNEMNEDDDEKKQINNWNFSKIEEYEVSNSKIKTFK